MTNHKNGTKKLPAKQLVAKKKPKVVKRTRATLTAEKFEGPIPPPVILDHYENILPGSADRIVSLAEEEAIHRRNMENKALSAQILETTLGQICGLIIGITTIGGGVIASIYGHALVGGAISTVGVVGLVSVFVLGRKEAK